MVSTELKCSTAACISLFFDNANISTPKTANMIPEPFNKLNGIRKNQDVNNMITTRRKTFKTACVINFVRDNTRKDTKL